MSRLRVQAPELQGPEPLRPAPIPSDTFAQAARPVIDNNLARLADALGVFNTSLQSYGTAALHKQKYEQDLIDDQIYNKQINGLTPQQYNELEQKGLRHASQNPIKRTAQEKFAGEQFVEQLDREYKEKVASGEINLLDEKTDAAAVITKMYQERSQNFDGQGTPWRLANSPGAVAGVRAKLVPLRDRALSEQATVRKTEFEKQQDGMAYTKFSDMFDGANDGDPTPMNERIRNVYAELSSKNPNSGPAIPPQRLDKQLIEVARDRATRPDHARAALDVLVAPRKDENGNPLPPVAANPKYRNELQSVFTSARNTLATKYKGDEEKVAVDQAIRSLEKKDGSFATLIDTQRPNPFKDAGDPESTFTLKADTVRKEAVRQALQSSIARGGPAAEQFNREWDLTAGNNVEHPVWKETLTTAATAFTDPASVTDPARRQKAIEAAQLYMHISEKNPAYAKSLLSGDKTAADFYTVYRAVRSEMNQNDDRALSMAAQAIRPESEEDLGVRQQRAKTVAEKVTNRDWGVALKNYFPGINDSASNVSDIQKRVMDVASVLVRVNGLDLDKAVDASIQSVANTSMVINKHLVPLTGQMPSVEQKAHIETLLGQAYEQYGKKWGVESSDQLFVKPTRGGNYEIWIDRPIYGGEPALVVNKNGMATPAVLLGSGDSPNSITRLAREKQETAAAATQSDAERNRDSTLTSTPDAKLTPEQQARKQQLRTENRQATVKSLNATTENILSDERARGLARADAHEHVVENALNGLKAGANISVELLKSLGKGLLRLNETR